MRKYTFIILLLTWANFGVQGQQIKRHVISSLGTNHVTANATDPFMVSATVGQPPNAGTIGTDPILRQGFQQPTDNCPIKVSFTSTENTLDGCGVFYDFEFTGDLDSTITVEWNFGPNALPMLASGPLVDKVGFTQTGSQTILLTVSNGECQKTVTRMVTATGTPFMALADKTDAACFGTKGSISLTVLSGTAPIQYLWTNGGTTGTITGLSPNEYGFTITDSKGCKFSSQVVIAGAAAPFILDAHVFDELCEDTNDGSIELSPINATLPVKYLWNDGSSEPKLANLGAGEYKVTVTDSLGCQIDTLFTIREYCNLDEEEFIPDVFSPNGDGINDLWLIPMLDRFPEHEVSIFNRWGTVVWTGPKGGFAGWAGVNDANEEVPIGAYYYVVRLNDASDTIFKGSVTIVR